MALDEGDHSMHDEGLVQGEMHAASLGAQISTFALWLLPMAALAVVLARIAVWIQSRGFAAIGVFPMIFGATIGVAAAIGASLLGLAGRRMIITVAILSSLITAAAEHGFFYLDYRHECESKFQKQLEISPMMQQLVAVMPDQVHASMETFSEFMGEEAAVKWPLWVVDATAMIVVAALSAWWISRTPWKPPAR
jgi:hypothetical protein